MQTISIFCNCWSRCFLVPCVHQISNQKGQLFMEHQVKIGILHRYFLRYEVNTQIFITIFFEKRKRQKNKCCRFLIWAPNNSWISHKNHQINLHGTSWESPRWISPHLDPFQSRGGPGLAPQEEKSSNGWNVGG